MRGTLASDDLTCLVNMVKANPHPPIHDPCTEKNKHMVPLSLFGNN